MFDLLSRVGGAPECAGCIGVYLAPLMTPVVRRSGYNRDDDTPWRSDRALRSR